MVGRSYFIIRFRFAPIAIDEIDVLFCHHLDLTLKDRGKEQFLPSAWERGKIVASKKLISDAGAKEFCLISEAKAETLSFNLTLGFVLGD
jgi:hypothetical protein